MSIVPSRFAPVLASVLLAGLASAQSPKQIADTAVAKYQAVFAKKDAAALGAMMAPDFVQTDPRGNHYTKAQSLAELRKLFAAVEFSSVKVTAKAARRAEGGVLFREETKLIGTMKTPDDKATKLASSSQEDVLLVRQGGRWVAKRIKSIG